MQEGICDQIDREFESAPPKLDLDGVVKSAWHPDFQTVSKRMRHVGASPLVEVNYNICSRYVHGSGDWMLELARSGGLDQYSSNVDYDQSPSASLFALLHACRDITEHLEFIGAYFQIDLEPHVSQFRERLRLSLIHI